MHIKKTFTNYIMGRNSTNPNFVCPRCRYSTRSSQCYKQHMFGRKRPCLPHAEGYMQNNYQPGLIIREMARCLDQPDGRSERETKRAINFFKKLHIRHWSIKMIPEDERETIEKILVKHCE